MVYVPFKVLSYNLQGSSSWFRLKTRTLPAPLLKTGKWKKGNMPFYFQDSFRASIVNEAILRIRLCCCLCVGVVPVTDAMRCGGGCGKEPTHTAPRLHIFIFGQMHCAMGMGQNPVFDCLLVITGQRELIFLEPKGCFQVSNWILYQFKGIRVGGVVWVSGRLVWKLLTNSRGTPYQRVFHISRNVFSHSLTRDAGTNRGLGNISALWFWPFYVPFHSYSDPAIHSLIFSFGSPLPRVWFAECYLVLFEATWRRWKM